MDNELRALVEVQVGASRQGNKSVVIAWIDTAFNGGLVLPQQEIERLGLKEDSITTAVLADGKVADLPTYTCFLDWFGKAFRTQVVANEGAHPLLGTMLLDGHDLAISYRSRS